MGRDHSIHRLTAKQVENEHVPPGRTSYMRPTADVLIVKAKAGHETKSWVGLGPLHTVSLATAREQARELRELRLKGIDPKQHRRAERAKNQAAAASVKLVSEVATMYMDQNKVAWTNKAHRDQWESSLKAYVLPHIGRMNIADVGLQHMRRILDPIWSVKPETASRVRQRVEKILAFAIAQGFRKAGNVARWDLLEHIYASPTAVKDANKPSRRQPALPYTEMGEFLEKVRAVGTIPALTLEFAAFVGGCRRSDLIAAKVADVDRENAVWTIGKFSKTKKQEVKSRRFPLSTGALDVLDRMDKLRGDSPYLFPGTSKGRLYKEACRDLIGRLGYGSRMCLHGVRAPMRTWMDEEQNFPKEVAKMALGHVVGFDVERAYARGDLMKKRIAAAQAWANYLLTKRDTDNVIMRSSQGSDGKLLLRDGERLHPRLVLRGNAVRSAGA
jgi:integrase